MQNTQTLKRHAALVDRMSDTLGLDLEEVMLRGGLSIPDLDDAVLRCTGCSQVGACETWLATRSGKEDLPPAYCRNTELFTALKRG